jgi:hypothetical protein
MGGFGSSRSKMSHVGWRKAILAISPDFSPNSFCHAAQFRMADGNPVVPLPNTTDHKIDANRKKGPISEPFARSTSLVGLVLVSQQKIAAAS